MALFYDISNTSISYERTYTQAFSVSIYHRYVSYCLDSTISITLKTDSNVSYKPLLVMDSTDDIRWILKKLYND